MNIPLKVALIEQGTPAYKTAMAVGIHHTTLSKFISGIQDPTQEEKENLAKTLNRPVTDLFPPSNDPAAA